MYNEYNDDNDNEDEIFEANDDYVEYVCPDCGSELYENRYGYLVCPQCDDDYDNAS